MDKEKINRSPELGQRKRSKAISVEAATLCFSLITSGQDARVIEQAMKLALRTPDPIGGWLKAWLESQGQNVHLLLSGAPPTETSQAEVRELIEPALRRGAEIVTLAQIADIYLFDRDLTPDNIVYAFYIGTRFAITRERRPTKKESQLIWDITLRIARASKIGAPRWTELESQSPTALKDWLYILKENARKRYETFLAQKKRAEESANNALSLILSDLFGD